MTRERERERGREREREKESRKSVTSTQRNDDLIKCLGEIYKQKRCLEIFWFFNYGNITGWVSPRGLVVNLLDYSIVVSELELRFRYFTFGLIPLRKEWAHSYVLNNTITILLQI